MAGTEILLLKTIEKTVTEERKYGVNITIVEDSERALELIIQRAFDIVIIDSEIPNDEIQKTITISRLHIPDLVTVISHESDADFSSAVSEGLRNKMIRNFGLFQLRDKN